MLISFYIDYECVVKSELRLHDACASVAGETSDDRYEQYARSYRWLWWHSLLVAQDRVDCG